MAVLPSIQESRAESVGVRFLCWSRSSKRDISKESWSDLKPRCRNIMKVFAAIFLSLPPSLTFVMAQVQEWHQCMCFITATTIPNTKRNKSTSASNDCYRWRDWVHRGDCEFSVISSGHDLHIVLNPPSTGLCSWNHLSRLRRQSLYLCLFGAWGKLLSPYHFNPHRLTTPSNIVYRRSGMFYHFQYRANVFSPDSNPDCSPFASRIRKIVIGSELQSSPR